MFAGLLDFLFYELSVHILCQRSQWFIFLLLACKRFCMLLILYSFLDSYILHLASWMFIFVILVFTFKPLIHLYPPVSIRFVFFKTIPFSKEIIFSSTELKYNLFHTINLYTYWDTASYLQKYKAP